MEKDKYIGKRLEGRYEIQELIGMGGMANVYKAYDAIDDRTVAVKILRDEFLGNTEFLRRFKNESKAIAVLSHPNIVRVFDVSFTGSVHSIVMEYIDGITLKDYIERQGVLTWKEAVHFTLQILRALQHAHDKGIVHRDIKPHNIMLLQNGAIKVTDFGIARFARSDVKTITDRAIGSVHYISPEQAMGESTDEKSDIYSVGVMLFEMLTGRLPFEADTAVSVAIKQIQTQAQRPTSINPSIPEGLEDITIRAMQKDAARRYRSAAEMISDIEKFKENPSIHFQYKYLDVENSASKNKKMRRVIDETREDENMRLRRKTPYIPILTGVTLAFVLASAGFIFLMLRLNNPFEKVDDIPVPVLVGKKLETAILQHDDVDIVADPEYVFTDEYAKGVICEQQPKASGPNIKVGSTVRVKISNGPKIITLENFTGKDAVQAMQKLREDGLEVVEEREYSTEVPPGTVIYTDPSKGSTISSGTTVTVYVSDGPKESNIEVPSDLIGMDIEEANRYLEITTLRIGKVTEEPSDQPAGTIIATSPEVGTMQPKGSVISVVISKGGGKKIQLNVPLPNMKQRFTIRARNKDGDILAEDTLDADTQVWRPTILGQEGESIEVRIFISTEDMSGRRYKNYQLDFDAGTQEETSDRSNAPEFNS